MLLISPQALYDSQRSPRLGLLAVFALGAAVWAAAIAFVVQFVRAWL